VDLSKYAGGDPENLEEFFRLFIRHCTANEFETFEVFKAFLAEGQKYGWNTNDGEASKTISQIACDCIGSRERRKCEESHVSDRFPECADD
jgi:hypothetical protein